jgi:putative YhdH/YhfP family quinone oxidoreductase
MTDTTFSAYVIEEKDEQYVGTFHDHTFADLPDGDLLIKVEYSSLNYKDALSASGNKGVTRNYPHVPGIDAAGEVVESKVDTFAKGDKVIVTSYDLGMNTHGGFSEYIRVPAAWALKLPEGLTTKESMMYGTAGLTAGMSVFRLRQQVQPADGPVLVSGATGGVGSIAVAMLAKLGYQVTAITGKKESVPFLEQLGAKEVVFRQDLPLEEKRPMLKTAYAGAIDAVGGPILEYALKCVQPQGVVTCCGNVASPKLTTTVFPFILRGISLVGIDSQNFPMEERQKVWHALANELKPAVLTDLCQEINLWDLRTDIKAMLEGKSKGHKVIRIAE